MRALLQFPLRLVLPAVLVATLTAAAPSAAQPPAAPAPAGQGEPTGPPNSPESGQPAMLAKRLANPLADLVSVPFQFNWANGVGPEEDVRQVLNIQPVIPFSISERWNVISRVIMPFISQPAALGSSSGAGDILGSAFFSPKGEPGSLIWGIGPVVNLPTTTDPTLGSGKWSAGPTAIVMKQQGPWTLGALANQLWSFADRGSTPRPEVSQMLVQPFVSFVTSGGVTLTLMSETTANWKARDGDTWTVPVMGILTKITRIGPLPPVALQAGGGVYAAAPRGGPNWQLRTALIVILPKGR